MEHGDGKHLTMLHLYTDYKLTNKALSEMTILQYKAIFIITKEVSKFKRENKPMVVI